VGGGGLIVIIDKIRALSAYTELGLARGGRLILSTVSLLIRLPVTGRRKLGLLARIQGAWHHVWIYSCLYYKGVVTWYNCNRPKLLLQPFLPLGFFSRFFPLRCVLSFVIHVYFFPVALQPQFWALVASIVRLSPDQWVSQYHAIQCYRSFYCACARNTWYIHTYIHT
jgi:hypothetical protein